MLSSDALHGEKVGVGTLICAKEYHRLVDGDLLLNCDYERATDEYITRAFGEVIAPSVILENQNDPCANLTREDIKKHIEEIREVVRDVPTADELQRIYTMLGVTSTLLEIGVPDEKLNQILEYSPLVRCRLTLMRLARATR